MNTLQEELQKILQEDKRLYISGKLSINKIIELVNLSDSLLLKQLVANKKIKKYFFQQIDDVLVFDKTKLTSFISNQSFTQNNGTISNNKIGLTYNDTYISAGKEVVLSWPNKDHILEGGQTKEQSRQNEIFHHEIFATEKIDKLLSKKAFTNFKHYTEKSIGGVKDFSNNDNFIIKGDNLVVLHSIASVFAKKVKLIYIDPPYNTGNDQFIYNDTFTHSTWLTFMRNRIEAAKELLTEDGTIWINIDDKESHYLKVLCDEIFGRENFLINFIWQKKYAAANDAKWFSDTHDHILVFAKNKPFFKPNLLPRSEEMNRRYKNPDNDARGPWKPGGFSVKTYSKEYDYPITTPSGKIVYPPKGSCWQTSKTNYQKKLTDGRIWFGVKGDSKPQIKQFLSEVQQGAVAKSIWTYDEVGHNQISRSEIIKLFGEFVFATPKPEKLLKRIIELSTKEGDYVLDFFLGSGTTAAVAHKMNRKYIGIDQMEYIETVAMKRLQKVMAGEQGGISTDVDWKGGGSCIYMELAQLNMLFIKQLNKTRTEKELEALFKAVLRSPALELRFNKALKNEVEENYKKLDSVNRRKLIINLLNKNNLYVCNAEADYKDYKVSSKDVSLNKKFYSLRI